MASSALMPSQKASSACPRDHPQHQPVGATLQHFEQRGLEFAGSVALRDVHHAPPTIDDRAILPAETGAKIRRIVRHPVGAKPNGHIAGIAQEVVIFGWTRSCKELLSAQAWSRLGRHRRRRRRIGRREESIFVPVFQHEELGELAQPRPGNFHQPSVAISRPNRVLSRNPGRGLKASFNTRSSRDSRQRRAATPGGFPRARVPSIPPLSLHNRLPRPVRPLLVLVTGCPAQRQRIWIIRIGVGGGALSFICVQMG